MKTPLAVIALRQTVRRDVVIDRELRDVIPLASRANQPLEEVHIFAPAAASTPDAPERCIVPADCSAGRRSHDRVAAHHHAVVIAAVLECAVTRFHPANHGRESPGQPAWCGRAPPRQVRTRDEIDRRVGEHPRDDSYPLRMDFFVVIQHADHVGVDDREPMVERDRLALNRLEPVLQRS